MSRQFLVTDTPEHSEMLDQFIMEHLRETDGSTGSSWSGVYTDGTQYGVLWAAPASALFGDPKDDPSVVVIEETEDLPWIRFVPPVEEVQP